MIKHRKFALKISSMQSYMSEGEKIRHLHGWSCFFSEACLSTNQFTVSLLSSTRSFDNLRR